MEKTFREFTRKPPRVNHKPITKIISKQLDIKLGPFTQKELDSVLRKIKNRKVPGLDEIPAEVWNTWEFDDILLSMPYIIKTQGTEQLGDASPPYLKRATTH